MSVCSTIWINLGYRYCTALKGELQAGPQRTSKGRQIPRIRAIHPRKISSHKYCLATDCRLLLPPLITCGERWRLAGLDRGIDITNPSSLPKRSELDPAGAHLYINARYVLDLAEIGEKWGLQPPWRSLDASQNQGRNNSMLLGMDWDEVLTLGDLSPFNRLWPTWGSCGGRLAPRLLILELLPVFLLRERWIQKPLPTIFRARFWFSIGHTTWFVVTRRGNLCKWSTKQPVWVVRPNVQCEIRGIFMHRCFTFFLWALPSAKRSGIQMRVLRKVKLKFACISEQIFVNNFPHYSLSFTYGPFSGEEWSFSGCQEGLQWLKSSLKAIKKPTIQMHFLQTKVYLLYIDKCCQWANLEALLITHCNEAYYIIKRVFS